MRWIATATALVLGTLALSCARLHLASRYLGRCPASGPEPSADLDLDLVPMDLEQHYREIRSRSSLVDVSALGEVEYAGSRQPILEARWSGARSRWGAMVIAGVHGNETAGLLAVPRLLDLLEQDRPRYAAWTVTFVTPANPIGVLRRSRYNGQGCDINRDFDDPRTQEARLLRDAIARARPVLLASLHEGPQDGFMLIATSRASDALAKAAVEAVAAAGVPLARTHFVGFPLGNPGLSVEGAGSDLAKWLLRLHTMGRFANELSIGAYTTESPWSRSDHEMRVRAHVVAVEALLRTAPDVLGGPRS